MKGGAGQSISIYQKCGGSSIPGFDFADCRASLLRQAPGFYAGGIRLFRGLQIWQTHRPGAAVCGLKTRQEALSLTPGPTPCTLHKGRTKKEEGRSSGKFIVFHFYPQRRCVCRGLPADAGEAGNPCGRPPFRFCFRLTAHSQAAIRISNARSLESIVKAGRVDPSRTELRYPPALSGQWIRWVQ